MTVLPDHEIEFLIREKGLISGGDPKCLQPASYDVHLAPTVLIPVGYYGDDRVELQEISVEEASLPLTLWRGDMFLGSTVERVAIPDDLVGRIEGCSSVARAGIQIHSAGYLDPGFRGNVTLEIVSFWPRPLILRPYMKIAQLSFEWLSSRCERPYGSDGLGSHYQDSRGVVASRYGRE